MFALPPPPTNKYNASTGLPATLETHNVLRRLEGPEYTLQVGEGIYILRDDLQLSTPPPHPSEAPPTNPNPLATAAVAPTAGVRLLPVIISPKKSTPQVEKSPNLRNGMFKWTKLGLNVTEKEVRKSLDASSDTSAPAQSISGSNNSSSAPAFGEGNVALTPALGKEGAKRRKPKNNIVKSNSSFVSRVIPHDQLAKRVSERDPSGLFAFANINRAFQWLDLSSNIKQEPLAKVLFTKAHMLCHDVNSLTKSTSHLDVVMGSSAGDILWYEPMSQKYARINKNGTINDSPVSCVKWIPGSENHFLAAHMDGSLLVYDKEKEDAPFVAEEAVVSEVAGEGEEHTSFIVTKSVNSSNQRVNPVACWRISNHRINDFAFAPDARHLAVVTEDGCLQIIDYLREKMVDVYSSYYGGFICVCWSPDGKYILTGGQDDLVSIWSLSERRIVARCHGHDSWVTAVAFDPWRCDERTYRFGSVGDDCKLLLWDFSVGMLHRPKGVSGRTRGSVSAQSFSLQRQRTESASIIQRLRSDSNRTQSVHQDVDGEAEFANHPVEPWSRTAQLPPVLVKIIDDHPLSWIGFEEDAIITSCLEGHIRTWNRPHEGVNGSQINLSSEQAS